MKSGLLHPGLLKQGTVESLRGNSMTEGVFGSLASALGEAGISDHLQKLATDAETYPADRREVWRSAVAREILLARSWGLPVPESVAHNFNDSRPFTSGPSLSDLSDSSLAVACFPLDHGAPGDIPPWATLWLIDGDGDDMRQTLSEWNTGYFDPGPRRIFLHVSQPRIDTIQGLSWTLSAHLAKRVLEDEGGQLKRHRQLALDWMLTGAVDENGDLRRVGIGNKLRIQTQRKWLFPMHNRGEVIGHAENLSDAFFPPNLEAAWSLFTGEGSVDGRSDVEWPQDLGSLHSFTSFSWGPMMAGILLAAPRRVILWQSNDPVSQSRAEAIRVLLQRGFWTDHPPLVEVKDISSASLPQAERQLREDLLDDLAQDEVVIFNFTNGNRIMGLAPHGLAKSHPNLWLIYRDQDKDCFQFELIRYKGVHPTAECIAPLPPSKRGPAADKIPDELWERLFSKDPQPRGNTAEEMRETLGGREVGKNVIFPPE